MQKSGPLWCFILFDYSRIHQRTQVETPVTNVLLREFLATAAIPSYTRHYCCSFRGGRWSRAVLSVKGSKQTTIFLASFNKSTCPATHGAVGRGSTEELWGSFLTTVELYTSIHHYLNTSIPQCLDTSTPQYLNTPISQYLTSSQWLRSFIPQYLSTSIPQYLNTSVPQYLNISIPQYPNTSINHNPNTSIPQ